MKKHTYYATASSAEKAQSQIQKAISCEATQSKRGCAIKCASATKMAGASRTSEAREFIAHWADDPNVSLTASLAGVTENAPDLGVQTRIGGFSYHNEDGTLIDGASAMAAFVKDGDYAAIIDVTHPFATQISANARAAAEESWDWLFRLCAARGNRWQMMIGTIMIAGLNCSRL